MRMAVFQDRKIRVGVQLLFVYAWLSNLMETDAFLSVYLLCGLTGMVCMRDNVGQKTALGIWARGILYGLSALFGIATVLANYPLFVPARALLNLFNIGCSLIGGFFVAYNVLLCMIRRFPLETGSGKRLRPGSTGTWAFFGCFGCIAAVYLLFLFTTGYPVYLAADSINSMNQIRSGEILNNHPYWYTQFIGLCLRLGWLLTGSNNGSCAVYSAIQCILMAACFAYALVTLYQAGIPKWCVAVVLGMYAFLPHNLTYSITMWKDTLFGGCSLVIITAAYRILKDIGKHAWLNYLVMAVGGAAFCVIRHNGWPMMLVWMVFLLLFERKNRKLLGTAGIVLVIGWFATHLMMDLLGVREKDLVEVLAVPLQQIARVIAVGCPIDQSDLVILERIFHMDLVQELYSPEIVDPIKFKAMKDAGQQYIQEHMGQFLRLWLRLGAQNPGEYLKAWVELTKGYWNGGYYFWIYIRYTYPDLTGIGGFKMNNLGKDVFDALFRYLEKPVILQPFFSIGLQTWTIISCCFVSWVKKGKTWLISVPMVALAVGLWFVTPVYAEFRYAYPLFVTCPVILLTTIFSGDSDKKPYIEAQAAPK